MIQLYRARGRTVQVHLGHEMHFNNIIIISWRVFELRPVPSQLWICVNCLGLLDWIIVPLHFSYVCLTHFSSSRLSFDVIMDQSSLYRCCNLRFTWLTPSGRCITSAQFLIYWIALILFSVNYIARDPSFNYYILTSSCNGFLFNINSADHHMYCLSSKNNLIIVYIGQHD